MFSGLAKMAGKWPCGPQLLTGTRPNTLLATKIWLVSLERHTLRASA